MSPEPEVPLHNIQERLAEARVLMNDPASRPRAVEMLERIVSESAGTSFAVEAMEILQRHDAMVRQPDRRDPETESLREEWREIHHAWDGRLASFLDRLRQQPTQLTELLPAVVPDLRQWLAQGVEEIQRSLRERDPEPDPRHLKALRDLADTITASPRFEAELREDVACFHEACFGLLLRDIESQVRRCCEEWLVERAWELVGRLANPPVTYREEVRRLEAMIGAADEHREKVESTLHNWPDLVPEHWGELRVLLEAVAEARQLLADPRVIAPSQLELQQRLGMALSTSLQFLRRRASQACSLDDLRDFWRQYQRLRLAEIDPLLVAQPEWFQRTMALVEVRLETEVRDAESAARVEAIGQSLAGDLTELPSAVADRLAACAKQIERTAGEWKRMIEGEEFAPPEGLALAAPIMVPNAFAVAAPRFQELLERTRSSLQTLHQPEPLDPRRAFEEALREAASVLAEVPDHAVARRLQSEAETRCLLFALDQALGHWHVDEFFALTHQATPESPFRELAGCKSVLQKLAGLATQAEIVTSPDAAAWWRRWREEESRLPSVRPESLDRVLTAERVRRRNEWGLVLDRLLAQVMPADAWRAAAESLAGFKDEPGLESYYREILRRETVGRVEDLLAQGHWALAEERLAELSDRDPDFHRLSTRLAVDRARSVGGSVLSEELSRRWADVLAVCGEEAYRLLQLALGETWRKGDADTLRRLADVARRILRSPSAPQPVRITLEDWLTWLQIQTALEESVSVSGLRQLLAYTQADLQPVEWRARFGSLFERWRKDDRVVAQAWAFQAFPHLFAATADPAEALAERSDQLAERVALLLATETEPRSQALAGLWREVESCERDWRDLDDFLNILARPVVRHRPSALFCQSRDQLQNLQRTLADVEALESCDLRQEAAKARWNTAWQALSQELSALPVAVALKSRLERLLGLTRLTFFQNQLWEAARNCSDPDLLSRHRLFAAAAGSIPPIVSQFHDADQIGGEMWRVLSRHYWQEIPALAGDLLPPIEEGDLSALAARFDELETDEQRFRQAFEGLARNEPWVSASGGFLPESHQAYLDRYPRTMPSSRRVYRLFDHFARIAPRPDILRASTAFLPAWIAEYLNGGVP